jgi:hypothetical protein
MPTWDLSTRGNWELIVSESKSVVYNSGDSPDAITYEYTPIDPIYASATSHTLLVGVVSNTVRQHWFLGARVSQYLFVSPSSGQGLMSGVQVSDIYKAGLNRLTLVEFKDYRVVPYVVEVAIPYWIEQAYVEVWQYNGTMPTGSQPDFTELLNRLDAMQEKLNSLTNDLTNLEQYNG